MRLDDRTIKKIGWELSECMPDNYNIVEVGVDNVTHIDAETQHLGEYEICWLQVWKGDTLVARYNARNVDSIVYDEGDNY